jgi:hypothetical protein
VAVVIYPDCNKDVAHLGGVVNAVYARALVAEGVARAKLSARRDTGASYINVTRGDVDSFLNLNDPGGGALQIEFGRTGAMGKGGAFQGVFAITGAF